MYPFSAKAIFISQTTVPWRNRKFYSLNYEMTGIFLGAQKLLQANTLIPLAANIDQKYAIYVAVAGHHSITFQ